MKSAVDHIESGWEKSYWDPYGYSGTPSRVKVSEIKKPINNYKKAIGSDEGYLSLLWCYVHYGYAFVMGQGAYDASSVLNSLDSVFGEFLTLLCDFEHEMQKYTKG